VPVRGGWHGDAGTTSRRTGQGEVNQVPQKKVSPKKPAAKKSSPKKAATRVEKKATMKKFKKF
jgi:hypothetical protein